MPDCVGIAESSPTDATVQEVAGAPGNLLQQQGSSAGVYVGCMYSEFLDSVLEPLVRPVSITYSHSHVWKGAAISYSPTPSVEMQVLICCGIKQK